MFTKTPGKEGGHGRSNYQVRRTLQRRINDMGEEKRTVYTRPEDDCRNQRLDEYRDEDRGGYKNEKAPSEPKLIGALNRI